MYVFRELVWAGAGRDGGPFRHAGLIVMLRISGKRTLSKMNAFDFVVTVALGSTLATVFLSKDVVLAEGLLELALLIGLQWIVAGWRCVCWLAEIDQERDASARVARGVE